MYICKSSFHVIGSNVIFHPLNSKFTYRTISIGSNVSIGERAFFNATNSHIYIGSNIAFAPNVTIRGGNHRYDIVGKWITDYSLGDKRPEDDQPVYVEDDCWIGTNVTILRGVTIGRGSIIAAGSVVSRSTPPYTICGGIPARVLKLRWKTAQDILDHERQLYTPEFRMVEYDIQKIFDQYGK